MLLAFFLLFLFLIFPKVTFATPEFNLNQEIIYQVNQQGNATVKHNLTLTNNYSEIYPQNYQINITSPNIKNIIANDNEGNILDSVKTNNDTTTINLEFNQKNLGKNQQTNFNLNYSLPNFATQKGSTWEVALPEFKSSGSQNSLKIILNLPPNFGNLSFTSVAPKEIIKINQQNQIILEGQNIKNKKILLIFGDYQLFDFNLKYFLKNSKNHSVTSEIAIPPQTTTQKITYQKIDPPPQNIKSDFDGNWLAEYKLEANQELEINLTGQAKIIHSNQDKKEIDVNKYLKSQTFWPINNPNLIKVSQQLNSPQDIYNYVVNTLTYNYSNLQYATRKGADQAFLYPDQSLCTEFTDLFVTLARIKGIPAREVQGFAYTNNSKIKPINKKADILHAWPQYYDQQQQAWISVDPTWEKTTSGIDFFNDLDPNHFAFVFHGIDSQNPPSPGFYKDKNIKTIDINFASNELDSNYFPLEIDVIKQRFYQNPKLKIINPNFNSINNIVFSIDKKNWQKEINLIPPLGSIEINIPKFLTPKIQITINSNNNSPTTVYIKNPNFYFNLIIIFALAITSIGISGIIINNKRVNK
jgi:transglutaminase superfamily protein